MFCVCHFLSPLISRIDLVSKNLLANCFRNCSKSYGYYHQNSNCNVPWKAWFSVETTLLYVPVKVLITKTTLRACLHEGGGP